MSELEKSLASNEDYRAQISVLPEEARSLAEEYIAKGYSAKEALNEARICIELNLFDEPFTCDEIERLFDLGYSPSKVWNELFGSASGSLSGMTDDLARSVDMVCGD